MYYVHAEMKYPDLLETFKSKIRIWKPNNNYIAYVGFSETFE